MATEEKKITLSSSDGELFEITEVVAMESQTIKHLIEDDCAGNTIPVPNVTSKILSKVIEYCKRQVDSAGTKTKDKDTGLFDDDLLPGNSWDSDFLKVDMPTLFDLILAANYLEIKGLLDLTSKTVADKMAPMSPEEIREMFGIKNDFTPEEEAEIRRENSWAFKQD